MQESRTQLSTEMLLTDAARQYGEGSGMVLVLEV